MPSSLRAAIAGLAVGAISGLHLSATPASGQEAHAQQPELRSGQLTALTYNVAGLPEQLSGSDPAVNTPLISPLLNDYDLALVQESWINPDPPLPGIDFYHEILVSQVDHPYLSEPAPPPLGSDPRRPDALVSDGLNRMSQFPFGPLTRVMWPSCFGSIDPSDGGAADCVSQKGFSVARTTFAPGIEVDVYNLHGEAGNTELDRQARQEGFATLADFMAEHSAGRPVIVGGDFNLRRSRAADREVLDTFQAATGLTEVCEVLDCGSDDDVIDKFMFRSDGGVTVEALTHRFERDKFRRDDGEPLSDHDPLAVTFRWTGRVDDQGNGPDPDPAPGSGSRTTTTVPPSPSRPADDESPPATPVRGSPTFTG